MNVEDNDLSRNELRDEVHRIWDANAEWWDDQIGDGNLFQCELIEPAQDRLLDIRPGNAVLDVACGAGRYARRMAAAGANVVALDISEKFIERARHRTPPDMENIEYRVLDATDREALLALGAAHFDAAVATMALMDMAEIEPLFSALPVLLKPGGRFVFSVCHPCFHSARIRRFCEMYEEEAGRHIVHKGVVVSAYLTPFARKTEGIIGQPEPQYYFHRPLQALFKMGFEVGFVVDGLVEPGLEPQGPNTGLRWIDMADIPPVLIVRMRLARQPE